MVAEHEYTVKSEGGKRYLVIDYRGSPYGPSVADYPQCMREVITLLGKVQADQVVLAEAYERVYDEEQTGMLREISDLMQKFRRVGIWSASYLGVHDCEFLPQRHDVVVSITSDMLSTDPLRAYLTLLQAIKRERDSYGALPASEKKCSEHYLKTLEYLKANFEATTFIQRLRTYIRKVGKVPKGRTIYHTLFEVQIKPSFIGSRLLFTLPKGVELVDQYSVSNVPVSIYRHPEKIEYLYYVDPPEYNLSPEKYFILEKTKDLVSTYHPEGMEFMDVTTSKDYFRKIYEVTIADLARKNNIALSDREKVELAAIVERYTVGYGAMELLLSDRKLTDIYMDSPLGSKPIYVVHGDYGACQTNIVFSEGEAESIVSRFRSISGRPFDEAHSVMDLDLQDLETRVCVIGKPLAPDGIAFALRLHKETPWTLPQFVDVNMMDSRVAGLLSFLIDAQASTLVTGSRGSGKTSMMMALVLEILPSLRIIIQEDTLEMPVPFMRKVGYNIQRLKTQSAIAVSRTSAEVPPEEALRTALRLGDSVLIVGEVRSKEAKVLYEAMRVGAVGNVVMGTIHGESAYSVWDRIVNDLGVPNTSFKATDVVVVCAPIRFKGSLKKSRRLVEVTEVKKHWYEDPEKENGLMNLIEFDIARDKFMLKREAMENDSELFKKIQKNRGLSFDEIWESIDARSESKQFLVDAKNEYNIPDLLEANYSVRANSKYLLIQERMREETGGVDHKKALNEWKEWVNETFVKELVSRRKARDKLKEKKSSK
jgi:flagellar protein FlaI